MILTKNIKLIRKAILRNIRVLKICIWGQIIHIKILIIKETAEFKQGLIVHINYRCKRKYFKTY